LALATGATILRSARESQRLRRPAEDETTLQRITPVAMQFQKLKLIGKVARGGGGG